MSKTHYRSLLLATLAMLGLSSCANFFTPDSNHPEVLAVPMYDGHARPTGSTYVYHRYVLDTKNVKKAVSPTAHYSDGQMEAGHNVAPSGLRDMKPNQSYRR